MNIDYLNESLSSATQARDNFVATMGTDYSRSNLDRLQVLQAAVNEAQSRVDSASAANNGVNGLTNGTNGSGGAVGFTDLTRAPEVAAANMCVVTLIRNGKSDRCLEVRSDSTLGDVIRTLNSQEGGWDIRNLTFKRRVGPGQTADITDPANSSLGEGPHEIWVGNKVAGGLL